MTNINLKNKVKLNLGCGKRHKEGYINIDIQEPCDLKHDLRTPLPFADNSIDEIFAEDFIRILSRKEWEQLKKEMSRVLKADGKLEIIFLDLEYAFKAFINNNDKIKRDYWLRVIFGSQEDKYEFCKNGLNRGELVVGLFKNDLSDFEIEPLPKYSEYTEDPKHVAFFRLTCYKRRLPTLFPRSKKILIGAPIHADYPIGKWLKNISKIRYPADLLLVDSSSGLEYVEKVKGYCAKYGIKNYTVEHIEVWQPNGADEKIGRSREAIRQYILSHDYDAWLSLECDQIVPVSNLERLIGLMEVGDFKMIFAPSWAKKVISEPYTNFGCAIIKRECLKKQGFLIEYAGMPNCWHGVEVFFKKRVLMDNIGDYLVI